MPRASSQEHQAQVACSVVLLTRNREGLLGRCLASLAGQKGQDGKEITAPWEVVVLDTGSTDGTPALLERWCELSPKLPFTLHWQSDSSPGAFAKKRNRAIETASADILFFIDDDCELPPDWLARGLALLEGETQADAKIGGINPPENSSIAAPIAAPIAALGGAVLTANRLPFAPDWHPDLAWSVGIASPGYLYPSVAGRVYYPQTANMAARREALGDPPFTPVRKEFGALDGNYLNEREDSQLWRRFRRRGERLAIDPAWTVFHATPPQRADWENARERARNDGRAEARQRFNRTAAHQAAESIWQERLGAVVNLLGSWRGKHWYRINESPKASLLWAIRERAHHEEFKNLAPQKWRRPLTRGVVSGAKRGLTDQAKGLLRPLVLTLSGERRRVRSAPRPIPPAPKSVAVLASGFLGDMLLLQPCLRALKARAGGQEGAPRISLIGSAAAVELHAGADYIDEALTVEEVTQKPFQQKADIALVPYWQNASAKALWRALDAAGAPPWVTFDHDVGFARSYLYEAPDRIIRKDVGLHEQQNLARLFQWAGLKSAPLPFEMKHIPDDPATLSKVPEGPIVIQPGSAQPDKVWSWGAWAEVAATLRRETGRPVVAVGSQQEAPGLLEWQQRHAHDLIVWPEVASPSLTDLFTLFRRADLLITTCSGPKHLAMAVGCPTLTLHGQSDERRWGAWFEPEKHRTLRALPRDLTPSERAGWAPNEEMLAIPPHQVIAAALKMIQ